MPLEPTEPVEVRGSRATWLLWSALNLILAVVVTVGFGWGWLGAIAFGAIAAVGLREAAVRSVRLRITDEGILDNHNPPLALGLIPWEEIVAIRALAGRGMVTIELRDPEAFRAGLPLLPRLSSKLWERRGLGPAVIQTWGLEASKTDIATALADGLERHELATVKRDQRLSRGEGSGRAASTGT